MIFKKLLDASAGYIACAKGQALVLLSPAFIGRCDCLGNGYANTFQYVLLRTVLVLLARIDQKSIFWGR